MRNLQNTDGYFDSTCLRHINIFRDFKIKEFKNQLSYKNDYCLLAFEMINYKFTKIAIIK
jgi:hypothetical protein